MNYDILSNPRYADMFYYDPLDCRIDQNHIAPNIVARMLYVGEDRTGETEACHHTCDEEMLMNYSNYKNRIMSSF